MASPVEEAREAGGELAQKCRSPATRSTEVRRPPATLLSTDQPFASGGSGPTVSLSGCLAIALETMAEMLCEYDQPVTSSERADFMQLVRRMAMDDRVERNLALCPDRP